MGDACWGIALCDGALVLQVGKVLVLCYLPGSQGSAASVRFADVLHGTGF